VKVLQFITETLGDASYLVVANGHAAAIDPQRDIRQLVAAAERHNAVIDYVFETHVHNDYLSGGRELAALGARVVAPEEGKLEFPHMPVGDGDSVEFGGASLRALLAPGHTYEHTVYIGTGDKGSPAGVFSGGALLMGSAGRSDLLGPEHTPELTRLQWETAQRIRSAVQPATSVFPTHGAGSFCSMTGSALERSGPLEVELGRNPALTSLTAEEFAAIQLASPAPIPAYYRHMGPLNRRGPKVYGAPPSPRKLEFEALSDAAVTVVDIRPRTEFVQAHVPGSLEVEESNSLPAYISWLTPFNAPLALVAGDAEQAARVTVDLFRIGYEDVRGYVRFADWRAAGKPVETLHRTSIEDARSILRSGDLPVLDTRFASEQRDRPLPGAVQLPFDEMDSWAATAPQRALVVCASGQRATMAASALKKAGKEVTALVEGGAEDLLA